jgi:protocatechuate 3,4-dioxygenase beta subunit
MKSIRALFLIVFVTATSQAQQNSIALSGVVIESGTNKPLPRVSLELRPYTQTPPAVTSPVAPVAGARYPGMTNENGQFTFRNIPPGQYSLTASRNGYVHADYGQRGPNGKSLTLTVTAGQTQNGIQLVMSKAAAISGHVFDSKGQPYPYMQIHARRVTYTDAQRTLTILSSTYTDDLGAYRLYGLPPGQYVLSAEGETPNQGILPTAAAVAPPLPGSVVVQGIGGSMAYTADPANQRKPAFRQTNLGSPVYFRAAANDLEAWPIDLREGDDLQSMDITYVPVPRANISFSNSSISGLTGLATVAIIITPGPTVLRAAVQANTPMARLTAQLAPGPYVAVMTVNALTGLTAFDVSPSSSPTVSIALNPRIPLEGRIMVDGPPNGPEPDFSRIQLRLRKSPALIGLVDTVVSPTASGSFSTTVPVDGDYSIQLSFPDGMRDLYLKSETVVRVSGQAPGDLRIVLAPRGGQLDGAVMDATRAPMSNVTALLVPEQRQRTDLFRSATTDSSGRFRFEGIVPGRYLLLAWEDVEQDVWFNPAFLRAFEDRGKTVVISEGSRETVDATAIPMH